MSLSCHCPDGDFDWYWHAPDDYSVAPAARRRKRCKSCGELIDHGATITVFNRDRYPVSDIEERIFGDGLTVDLAPWWLCEPCSDLYWSLSELGFCVSPDDDMRNLAEEYAAIYSRQTMRGNRR